MASRTFQLGLASVFASLVLACGSGEHIDASREAVHGADLKMSVNASTDPLAGDSSTACFDVTTNGANITYIFVDSACAASPRRAWRCWG